MSSRIDQIVCKHVKKYKTNDPFEIAELNKIIVKFWNFNGEVFGMYRYESRNRFVFINRNLPISQQIFTCGHEVFHALYHKDIKITLETYYHVLPGKQEQAVKNFGDFFFKQQEK